MKPSILHRQFLKSLSILCLSFGILVASCGVKIAITQSLKIDNFSGQSLKSAGVCSFTALENQQEKLSIQQKKSDNQVSDLTFQNSFSSAFEFQNSKLEFPLSRSVPLYILYQQQRDALQS